MLLKIHAALTTYGLNNNSDDHSTGLVVGLREVEQPCAQRRIHNQKGRRKPGRACNKESLSL
jgi:hypothetical protein